MRKNANVNIFQAVYMKSVRVRSFKRENFYDIFPVPTFEPQWIPPVQMIIMHDSKNRQMSPISIANKMQIIFIMPFRVNYATGYAINESSLAFIANRWTIVKRSRIVIFCQNPKFITQIWYLRGFRPRWSRIWTWRICEIKNSWSKRRFSRIFEQIRRVFRRPQFSSSYFLFSQLGEAFLEKN